MIPAFMGKAAHAMTETGSVFIRETGNFLYQVTFATSKRIYDDWDLMTGCQLAKMVGKSTLIACGVALVAKKQPFFATVAEHPRITFLFAGIAIFSHLTHVYLENESSLNFSNAANEQNDLLDKYPLLEKVLSKINN